MFLDKCYLNRDVKSALRLANMSITFHKRLGNAPRLLQPCLVVSDTCDGLLPFLLWRRLQSPGTSLHDPTDSNQATCDHKCYIQHEAGIHQHNLWHLDGFWEDALLEGVTSQLNLMEAVLWDELDPDQLKEKVIGEVVV